MNGDRDPRSGDALHTRTEGLRRIRRVSNWTAAALIVGAGGTALALAHQTVPVAGPVAGAHSAPRAGAATTAAGGGGGQVSGTVATTSASGVTTTLPAGPAAATTRAAGGAAPQVAHTVATTSASGVTTTTTTRVVNGRTVVTQVRHAPAFHDN